MPTPSEGSDPGSTPPLPGASTDVESMYRTIQLARERSTPADLELVQDLETAYEELRVADEEVRAQQEQIAGLLESQHLVRWQQERATSLLPVPAVITSSEGVVQFVNAAAAMILRRSVVRIVGKPLMVFFSAEDRPALRRMMSTHGRDQRPFRRAATLVDLQGRATSVECTVSAVPASSHMLSWLLLSPSPAVATPGLALPEALTSITALPTQHDHRDDVLRAAAKVCDDVLGTDVCLSLVVGTPLEPEVLASTAPLAQAVDGAQITAGEGPCASAFETGELVVTPHVHTDPRWPDLSRVLDRAVVAVVAIPLEVGDQVVGALNLYTTATLRPELAEHGELLAATIAAVLHELDNRRQLQDLTREMESVLVSRAAIEQAKGVVMAHRGIGPDDAFAHLVALSSSRHLKLRDVATQIVAEAAKTSG